MLARMYGPGMRKCVTKFVLTAVIAQGPTVYVFRYPVFLQGERKGRMWLKMQEQIRHRVMLTLLGHCFPFLFHEQDARNLKVDFHQTIHIKCPQCGFLTGSMNIVGKIHLCFKTQEISLLPFLPPTAWRIWWTTSLARLGKTALVSVGEGILLVVVLCVLEVD